MVLELLPVLNHGVLLATLALLCLVGMWLVWLDVQHLRLRRRGLAKEAELLARRLPADERLPHVLVQIPLYNETTVVQRIAQAVGALDWPRDKLHIQILDDSDDPTTALARDAVAALQARGVDAILLHRGERGDFKAGALREGLRHSDHEFVAIFDADFVPAPDFLRLCLRPLLAEPDLAFVQARWDFINGDENMLTRAQRRILGANFVVEQTAKSWSGHVMNFNGSGGVWRRAAIDDAGGWSGDSLAEDMDLSFRAALAGWRSLYLLTVAAPGELPGTVAAWRAQQFRWAKGLGQMARKYLPLVWRSKLTLGRKLGASLNLAIGVMGPLIVLAAVSGAIDVLVSGGLTAMAITLASLAAAQAIAAALVMMVLGQRVLHRAGLWLELSRAAGSLVILIAAHLAASGGVRDALRGKASAFLRTPKTGDGIDRHPGAERLSRPAPAGRPG